MYPWRMDSLPELFDGSVVRGPAATWSWGDTRSPWTLLDSMDERLADLRTSIEGDVHPTAVLEGPVVLGEGARVAPHAYVIGPAWIGRDVLVGHGAHVRGGAIIMDGAYVGHACEVKHSILRPGATVAHFNYVGDSIVGARVNLGAGVKLANVKNDGGDVEVRGLSTGRRKLGSILGDDVRVGCNAVCAPGTVVGRGSWIYAGASVRGVVPSESIVKVRAVQDIVAKRS